MNSIMDHPFGKSITALEKCKRLQDLVHPEDSLAVIIDADPDSMASALALKRFFWRKIRKATIYHINPVKRADNLAFIKLLKIDLRHIRNLKPAQITKWAIVDSQPGHHEQFGDRIFDIIIDHHPVALSSKACFLDIREDYGANSTIMTEYLKAAKIRPSPKLATALFYGIKTDTDNFVRDSLPNDINAFRYLYKYTNMNIIKKIESSEMTRGTLASYRLAMDRLTLFKDTAFVYMGEVENPDILVVIADFFLGLTEATWSIVAGLCRNRVIAILRNAGFRGDAGKTAERLFAQFGGSGGGHRSAGRAEVQLEKIAQEAKDLSHLDRFVLKTLKTAK